MKIWRFIKKNYVLSFQDITWAIFSVLHSRFGITTATRGDVRRLAEDIDKIPQVTPEIKAVIVELFSQYGKDIFGGFDISGTNHSQELRELIFDGLGLGYEETLRKYSKEAVSSQDLRDPEGWFNVIHHLAKMALEDMYNVLPEDGAVFHGTLLGAVSLIMSLVANLLLACITIRSGSSPNVNLFTTFGKYFCSSLIVFSPSVSSFGK